MKLMFKTLVFCVIAFMAVTWMLDTDTKTQTRTIDLGSIEVNKNSPPCLQMYYSIEKYAQEYDVPRDYAYGIAYMETGYRGPFHWKYKHTQKSFAGAIGPMQIMPTTANWMWPGKKITHKKLMTDIEFNVETSMKLLRYLHDQYGDWKIAFGAYNTGHPLVNNYAINVYNHKPQFQLSK